MAWFPLLNCDELSIMDYQQSMPSTHNESDPSNCRCFFCGYSKIPTLIYLDYEGDGNRVLMCINCTDKANQVHKYRHNNVASCISIMYYPIELHTVKYILFNHLMNTLGMLNMDIFQFIIQKYILLLIKSRREKFLQAPNNRVTMLL
jgi:hypothetical protein